MVSGCRRQRHTSGSSRLCSRGGSAQYRKPHRESGVPPSKLQDRSGDFNRFMPFDECSGDFNVAETLPHRLAAPIVGAPISLNSAASIQLKIQRVAVCVNVFSICPKTVRGRMTKTGSFISETSHLYFLK